MITIALLYGGPSPEYDISLRSAETIVQHINHHLFKVITVHITKKSHWIVQIPHQKPITYLTPPPCLPCDAALLMTHGAFGENGTLQGLLNWWKIPYVGSDVLGSALAMDKVIAKQLVAKEKIVNILPFVRIDQHDWKKNDKSFTTAAEKLGYPIFVKPVDSGSSIGIRRVEKKLDLECAIQHAFQYGTTVLIEKALLKAREIEVGVLENRHPQHSISVSVAGEIITPSDFYSYDAKYSEENLSQLAIPACLTRHQTSRIQRSAQCIFKVLRLRHMARIDFFLSQEGKLYFNEVNTLPGFTETSMYPKLWEASGKSLTDLLTHLIHLVLH